MKLTQERELSAALVAAAQELDAAWSAVAAAQQRVDAIVAKMREIERVRA